MQALGVKRRAFTTIRTSNAGITADSLKFQQLGSRMLRVCFAYAIRIASVTTDVRRRRAVEWLIFRLSTSILHF